MSAEQGTEAWRKERAAKLTASRFKDVLKGGEYRAKYLRQLAFERLSGSPIHEAHGHALRWGKECEPCAREEYELETGNLVIETGFVLHPQYPFIGCSSDGLVGNDGAIEIKCPYDESIHVQTWLNGIPKEHIPQTQGNLLVTGRQWIDFVSYDPRQARGYQLYVQRVERDEAYIEKLLAELLQFDVELKHMVKTLINRRAA